MLLIVSPLRRNWLCEDSENGRVGLGTDVVTRLEDYRGPMLTAEVVGSMAGYNAKIDQNGSIKDWNCNDLHGVGHITCKYLPSSSSGCRAGYPISCECI